MNTHNDRPEHTAAWQLGPWVLEHDLAKIAQQQPALLALLDGPIAADPDRTGWNSAEHAAHCAKVSLLVARTVRTLLASQSDARRGPINEAAQALLDSGCFPRGKGNAPPSLHPTPAATEDGVRALKAASRSWTKIEARVDEIESSTAQSDHFAMGPLTASEWVRFCAAHTAHHLRIVREIDHSRI